MNSNNSIFQNASRQDVRNFQLWIKSQPFHKVSFLYQAYLRQEEREQKTITLFQEFLSSKSSNPLTPNPINK